MVELFYFFLNLYHINDFLFVRKETVVHFQKPEYNKQIPYGKYGNY